VLPEDGPIGTKHVGVIQILVFYVLVNSAFVGRDNLYRVDC
jgi:hypothetical protein